MVNSSIIQNHSTIGIVALSEKKNLLHVAVAGATRFALDDAAVMPESRTSMLAGCSVSFVREKANKLNSIP